jgi:hypothetical protein
MIVAEAIENRAEDRHRVPGAPPMTRDCSSCPRRRASRRRMGVRGLDSRVRGNDVRTPVATEVSPLLMHAPIYKERGATSFS